MRSYFIGLIFFCNSLYANNNALNWQPRDNVCKGVFVNDFDQNRLINKINIQNITYKNNRIYGNDIFASNLSVYLTAKSGKVMPEKLFLQGPINYYAPNYFVSAKAAKLSKDLNSGTWYNAVYKFYNPDQSNLWGSAHKIHNDTDKIWNLEHATVSLCSGRSPLWHIVAEKAQINRPKGIAKLYSNWLYLYDIPIIMVPYLSFAINKMRKTGWLKPNLGRQKYMGNFINLSWYWNIASNQDLLISPWISQHVGLSNEIKWRYLSKFGHTQIGGFIVMHDKYFSQYKNGVILNYATDPLRQQGLSRLKSTNNNRWSWYIKHKYKDQNNNIKLNWYYAHDDDITRQFSSIWKIDDLQYLPQTFSWQWQKNHFSSTISIEKWQVLHSLLWAPVPDVYQQIPHWHSFWFYKDFALDLDLANFQINNWSGFSKLPNGTRFVIEPKFIKNIGPLTFKLALHSLYEKLTNNSYNINIPKFAIDFKHRWLRLFYAYVPYKRQNQLAHFDVDWQPQFYHQLFQWNRFSGYDWLGDTNHIAIGVEKRLPKGFFAIGQGYAFTKHKLCLSKECTSDVWAHQRPSALHLYTDYKLLHNYHIQANIALNWYKNNSIYGSFNNELRLSRRHNLNFGYSKIQMPIDDVFSDRMWSSQPNLKLLNINLKSRWSHFLTSTINMNWDIDQNQASDSNIEITWHSCCSALHFGITRSYNQALSARNFSFENRVYIKFSLKG